MFGRRNSDAPESNPPGENVILQWNRVLQETIRTPGQQPPTIFPVRSFAMMHAAMFDAVNSIDGTYTPYLIEVPGSRTSFAGSRRRASRARCFSRLCIRRGKPFSPLN
ncbi:MAG: hypothetical protein WKF84_27645 [Pyrinomonadaceae bacterium]